MQTVLPASAAAGEGRQWDKQRTAGEGRQWDKQRTDIGAECADGHGPGGAAPEAVPPHVRALSAGEAAWHVRHCDHRASAPAKGRLVEGEMPGVRSHTPQDPDCPRRDADMQQLQAGATRAGIQHNDPQEAYQQGEAGVRSMPEC